MTFPDGILTPCRHDHPELLVSETRNVPGGIVTGDTDRLITTKICQECDTHADMEDPIIVTREGLPLDGRAINADPFTKPTWLCIIDGCDSQITLADYSRVCRQCRKEGKN